jgi:hypothetical protein
MRDRTLLDKKDSRHISGHDYVKKTTSKKKSRVGEAGKQVGMCVVQLTTTDTV